MRQFMADTDAQHFTVKPMRFYMLLLMIFAAVALAISAIGVYGVVGFSVSQRTYEIGVRIALGARRSDVVKLVLLQGLFPAVIGVTVGVSGAFWLTRLMANHLYAVSPTDPVTFVAATLLLMAAALLATYVPARRAARMDPAAALRRE